MLSEYERGYAEGAKDKVAAVEAAYKMGAAAAFGIEREQAVRDCIAAVEALHIAPWQWDHTSKDSYGDIRLEAWHEAAAALRALLLEVSE